MVKTVNFGCDTVLDEEFGRIVLEQPTRLACLNSGCQDREQDTDRRISSTRGPKVDDECPRHQ